MDGNDGRGDPGGAGVCSVWAGGRDDGGYTLIDAGSDWRYGAYPGIDENGNIGHFDAKTKGNYTVGTLYRPNPDSGQNPIATEVFLRKAGSDLNLLPQPFRDPGTRIADFNSLGHVLYFPQFPQLHAARLSSLSAAA